jgi:hypothetical protein
MAVAKNAYTDFRIASVAPAALAKVPAAEDAALDDMAYVLKAFCG